MVFLAEKILLEFTSNSILYYIVRFFRALPLVHI